MNEKEWNIMRPIIESKAQKLMEHEKKPHAWTGFAEKQHLEFRKGEISYYISFTKVFYHIMHSVLAEASQKFPEAFGKNRTDTIIEAIYKIAPIEVGNFTDFLQNEQLGYLFAFDKGVLLPKILRIDLFRKIDVRKDGGTDFTGGLFHAFKHFTYKGKALSTHSENHDIAEPQAIFDFIIDGFFNAKFENVSPDKYTSTIHFDERHILRFHFYYEQYSDVYFLVSIRKEEKKDVGV